MEEKLKAEAMAEVEDEDEDLCKKEEEEVEDGGSCRQGRVWRVPQAGRSRGLSLKPDKLRPPEPRREIGPQSFLKTHLRDAVRMTHVVLSAGLLLYTL